MVMQVTIRVRKAATECNMSVTVSAHYQPLNSSQIRCTVGKKTTINSDSPIHLQLAGASVVGFDHLFCLSPKIPSFRPRQCPLVFCSSPTSRIFPSPQASQVISPAGTRRPICSSAYEWLEPPRRLNHLISARGSFSRPSVYAAKAFAAATALVGIAGAASRVICRKMVGVRNVRIVLLFIKWVPILIA